MQLWNSKNLKSPPITTCKFSVNEQNVDIVELKGLLRQAARFRKKHNRLDQSSVLLSRWIYRIKTKFRADKGLKSSEKLHNTVLRYVHVNLFQLLQMFEEMVPDKYSQVTYLPTLNILHFTLVRIQGVSKLLVRIIELARATAVLIGDHIASGHMWKPAMICYTIAAEMFSLGKILVNFMCSVYGGLLPFTNVLRNDNFNWLPEGYTLPNDLKEWLGTEWCVDIKSLPKPIDVPMISNSDSEVENDFEETRNEDVGEVVSQSTPEFDVNMLLNSDSDVENDFKETKPEDIGEVVTLNCDSDVENDLTKTGSAKVALYPKVSSRKKGHDVNSQQVVNGIKTLKDLIGFESKCRRGELPDSKDKLKRKMLHNKVKKFIKRCKKESGNRAKVNIVLENARDVIKSLL